MRVQEEVQQVLALVAQGCSDVEASKRTGIPRMTIRDWRHGKVPGRLEVGSRSRACPICFPGLQELDERAYAYLLGLYLGDGCVSPGPRTYCLRIFLDSVYPEIVAACRDAIQAVRPDNKVWVGHSKMCRCNIVAMWSNHWPCLFPQMGPGRKHNRAIRLDSWQQEIISRERRALSED